MFLVVSTTNYNLTLYSNKRFLTDKRISTWINKRLDYCSMMDEPSPTMWWFSVKRYPPNNTTTFNLFRMKWYFGMHWGVIRHGYHNQIWLLDLEKFSSLCFRTQQNYWACRWQVCSKLLSKVPKIISPNFEFVLQS